jgi:Luciferase-like monooxygenase
MLPIHVGGSSAAAARRAGRRGDGFFPGGRLTPAERVAQIELMHTSALAEGRDPEVLEYTRWGSIDMERKRCGGLRRPGRRPPRRRHDLDRSERATPPTRGLRHPSRPATLSDLCRNEPTPAASSSGYVLKPAVSIESLQWLLATLGVVA